jgi:cell wall-associated NlpC family hydrolase
MRLAFFLFAFCSLCLGCAAPGARLRGGIDGSELVRVARQQIGVKYRYGGKDPEEGFDCSGLVHYSFAQLGVSVPRSASALFQEGHRIAKGNLEPGDLVFFDTGGGGVSHVGIYSGGDKMVHAPSSGARVREDNIANKYWLARFLGARRLD